MISTYGYFDVIKTLIYLVTCYYISSYTPENLKTSKEVNTVLNSGELYQWLITLHVFFQTNKREQIWESNKYIFPNRDVTLFSFGINSNITYST